MSNVNGCAIYIGCLNCPKQLAKVQATVLATCAPLVNFWSHMSEFAGKTEELIPVSDVIRVTQDTLALIGNASNYVYNPSKVHCSDQQYC